MLTFNRVSTYDPEGFEIFSVNVSATDLHEEGTLSIARLKFVKEEDILNDDIWILQQPNGDGQPNGISSEIAKALDNQGFSVHTVDWPPNCSDLKGKHIISLLELERPLLGDLSSEDFDILKTVSTQCSQLLWVTQGDDPVVGTALGYLRSLKNENPNLKLRYLLLENTKSVAKGIPSVIVQIATSPSIESEFSESNGYLCINRWVADSIMTKVTAKNQIGEIPECMALGTSEAPLKLEIYLGDTKSAIFTVDERAGFPLSDNELEIEVKATLIRLVPPLFLSKLGD